jgi:hypothetical protein
LIFMCNNKWIKILYLTLPGDKYHFDYLKLILYPFYK